MRRLAGLNRAIQRDANRVIGKSRACVTVQDILI